MRRALTTSCRRIILGRSLEVNFLSCPAASCSLLQRWPCCSASAGRQTAAALLSQPLGDHGVRGFAAEASDEGDEDPEIRDRSSDQVKKLAEQVMALSLLDVADLATILQQRLGVTPQMLAGGGGGGAPAAAGPAAAPAPAAPAAEAKTEFDVKLTGFDAASKVKVIKEVRTMTSLGLKEAKELVEKAPTVVKTGLKKEEAEELQKKLEAVGGKVSLE